MYTIKNQNLEVKVNEKGAELCWLYSYKKKIQYIWQADPEIWNRHAPILFPIVGALKDNAFIWNNNTYSMSQHGFARDKVFKILEESDNSIKFILTDDNETIHYYPFKFELIASFELSENKLLIDYIIKNSDSQVIYYSFGLHPGFRCPLLEGENYKDYYIEFELEENTNRWFTENGLLTDLQTKVLENSNVFPLNHKKFDQDVLLFKNIHSRHITFKSGKSKNGLIIGYDGFPYLGIWAKPGAEFVCVEPWHGLPDHKNSNQHFEQKEGIMNLHPGKDNKFSFSIEPIIS